MIRTSTWTRVVPPTRWKFWSTRFGVEAADGRPRRVGALEEAHGGSLYIDEVADMPREERGPRGSARRRSLPPGRARRTR
jgi:hypothetical protein